MKTTQLKDIPVSNKEGYYNLSGQWISKEDLEEVELSKQAYISKNQFLQKFQDVMNGGSDKYKREK